MKLDWLSIRGAACLNGYLHEDDRGFFRRMSDLGDLAQFGFNMQEGSLSLAHNHQTGTVRGMHFQAKPFPEKKLVWCTSGAAMDVLVDVRPEEPTYGTWVSIELKWDDPIAVLVPEGVAHGYQTRLPSTTMSYLISGQFEPDSARTLRWDDPHVGINWALPLGNISQKDASAPAWPTHF